MKPSRRFTAFGSARSPTRISGCSFLPVALNFASALTAIASTAWRATDSLSATTMMPLREIRGRPVEGRDRHVGFLRQRDQHRLRVAVVGGQDDAVGALRDAVLDLLELPVGILAAVQLDDLDAVLLQRVDDRRVAGAPEAGRQILEGVADLLAGGVGAAPPRTTARPTSAGAPYRCELPRHRLPSRSSLSPLARAGSWTFPLPARLPASSDLLLPSRGVSVTAKLIAQTS